jgi:ABC-type multidrug transport system fused ATPase/permease subunit
MDTALRQLFEVIPRRRRRQGALLFLLMILAGFAELATLGAVAPFLAVVAMPHRMPDLHGLPRFLRPHGMGRWDLTVVLALLFAACAIVAAALRVLLTWATQTFVFRLGYDLETLAYQRSLSRTYIDQIRINSSETIAILDQVGAISATVFLPLLAGVSSFLIAGFILAALIAIRPLDAMIALAGFGLAYLLISLAFRGRLRAASETVTRALIKRIQTLQEGLGGIRDVILDQAQPIYVERFSRIDLALRDAQASIGVIGAAPRFAIEGAGMVVIALLVLWLAGRQGGVLAALPLLGALALGAQRLLPLLQQVYNSWSQVAGTRQTILDVAALFSTPETTVTVPTGPVGDTPFTGSVSLKGVTFRYAPQDAPVLDRLDLDLPRGGRVGLVGRTGSGKSTVIDIVLGLLEPDEGEVRIDGRVLDPVSRRRWSRSVAHVPQNIYLSDATILENIAFGVAPDAIDLDRARAAAARADLAHFIEGLPRAYDTTVGERGVRLSGGQRQRVGIARALYKGSRFLVFDEATSALDSATEDAVLDAIAGLDRDLTILMVAHRLRTLRSCDVIYRLEDGRVVEVGGYDAFQAREAS